ncbi:replication initiator [Streptosporangium sp. NBC_01756]|uniref:replication initiator n=1 Tax=Streptosporangium sp. NBC_01756 TaxID=2975950 RepID=UPI002DDA378B|nr:replication initiator [Streptosporangium sp. NBC_01756]WSC88377.1 hypothetical protein OIE48_09380 [Streptosporangium sp. NBC_01756]
MLGYREHFSTKSRHYSTTLGTLRQARADYRAEQARMTLGLPAPDDRKTLTVSEWCYGGSGHRYGEPFWAELARQRIATPAGSPGNGNSSTPADGGLIHAPSGVTGGMP